MHDLASPEGRVADEACGQGADDEDETPEPAILRLGHGKPGEYATGHQRDRGPRGPRPVILDEARLHEGAGRHVVRGRNTCEIRWDGRHGRDEQRDESVTLQFITTGNPADEAHGHANDGQYDCEGVRHEVQVFPVHFRHSECVAPAQSGPLAGRQDRGEAAIVGKGEGVCGRSESGLTERPEKVE